MSVKAIFGLIVANPVNDIPHNAGNINVAVSGDFAHYNNHTRCCGTLAGNPRHTVLFQQLVKNGVCDSIAYFIGMTVGNRLGSKKITRHIYTSKVNRYC